MNKLVSWIVVFFVLMTMCAVSVAAVECTPTLPDDGCTVSADLTLVPGTYSMPNGITIVANNVVLDWQRCDHQRLEPRSCQRYFRQSP